MFVSYNNKSHSDQILFPASFIMHSLIMQAQRASAKNNYSARSYNLLGFGLK